jgi:hypothetical protein
MRREGVFQWAFLLGVATLTSVLLAPRGWLAICRWAWSLLGGSAFD